DNAATYAANAEAARTELAALDAELTDLLAPAAGWPLYVYHDAYGYFAEAYGLTIAGALAEGDAADPGAARIRALRAEVAAAEAACVFAEAGHDPSLVANLVEGTGLRVGTLDPSGVTLVPGPELYAALLRGLAEAIAACAD
ncbi:MAG: zinc ABC transporter substrate-binding protein, partial [Paracoccaceae bacterium]|nr:zinc ABC transporter substrate-binding protein [Paracoccaceae bacterium]